MGTIENILSIQLERDIFHNEGTPVEGIAKQAIDKGYDSLSPKQKYVLRPFLSKKCTGYVDFIGENNGCRKELSGEELLNAYEQYDDPDLLLCESCLEEAGYQAHRKAKMFKD